MFGQRVERHVFPVKVRSIETATKEADPHRLTPHFLSRVSSTNQLQESTIQIVLEIEQYYEFNKKIIHLKLMDSEDSLFYYEKKLDEMEFSRLATQQQILAGFAEFPNRLHEFVQLIVSRAQEVNPKYYALVIPDAASALDNSDTPAAINFNIYENNPFKQISLISLPFFPVSDDSIKARLIDLNRKFKQENYSLQNRLLDTERNLGNQLKEAKADRDVAAQELDATMRNLTRHMQLLSRHLDRSSIDMSIEEMLQGSTLAKRLEAMDSQISQALSQKHGLQKSLDEATARVRQLELDNQGLRSDFQVSAARIQAAELSADSIKSELDRERDLRQQLQQEALKKDRSTAMLQDELREALAKNNEYAADVELLKSDLHSLEDKCQELDHEIERANEIITKLQSDVRSYKAKAKKATSELDAISKDVAALKDSNVLLSKENSVYQDRVARLEKELLQEQAASKSLAAELKVAQSTVEKNEKTIDWLHRQSKDGNVGGSLRFVRQPLTMPKSFEIRRDEAGIKGLPTPGPSLEGTSKTAELLGQLRTPMPPTTFSAFPMGHAEGSRMVSPPQPTEYPVKPPVPVTQP